MNSKDSTKPVSGMKKKREACCSSPSAMSYWFAVTLLALGLLSLIGYYWHPLHASSAATILLAAAIGCFANWAKNRTYHCRITAPLFLTAAMMFLLGNMHVINIEPGFVWPFVLVGAGVSFLLEWRQAR